MSNLFLKMAMFDQVKVLVEH